MLFQFRESIITYHSATATETRSSPHFCAARMSWTQVTGAIPCRPVPCELLIHFANSNFASPRAHWGGRKAWRTCSQCSYLQQCPYFALRQASSLFSNMAAHLYLTFSSQFFLLSFLFFLLSRSLVLMPPVGGRTCGSEHRTVSLSSSAAACHCMLMESSL